MSIKISKQIKVKHFLECNIEKFSSKFNFKTNLNYLKDLEEDSKFLNKINEKIRSNMFFNKREFNSIYDFSVYRNFLYLIIRYIKPKKVVETGVLHGLTTAWILKALEDNKMGKLISIDLKRSDWPKYFKNKKMGPGYQFDMDFPEEEDAGWIVPDYLKNKWKLNYGPSSMYIKKIKNIDLFIHDSDHSYKNVKFEVETVLKNNKSSFVVIDNCNWNSYIFKLISQLNSNYYKQKLIYSFIDDVDDNLKSLESAVVFKKI